MSSAAVELVAIRTALKALACALHKKGLVDLREVADSMDVQAEVLLQRARRKEVEAAAAEAGALVCAMAEGFRHDADDLDSQVPAGDWLAVTAPGSFFPTLK